MAPMILLRSCACDSVRSARRISTTSRAPELSPARIMFTYRWENTFGCSPSASAKEAPSFTFCFTTPMIFFRRGCSICGIPAEIRVASWRVAMARSCADTPVKPSMAPMSTSRARPVFCSPATAPASAARASVRYTPSLRRTCRSTLLLSASRIPRTFLPASVRPVYSKTGMELGQVLLRDAEDFRHAGDAAHHLAGAVVHQGLHPAADGLPPDGAAVDVLEGELAEIVVDQHHLVDPGAAAVAGLVALVAAGRLVEHPSARLPDAFGSEADLLQLLRRGQVRGAAVLAQHAHQALREDAHP